MMVNGQMNDFIKNLLEEVGSLKAIIPIPTDGRMVEHRIGESQSQKPPIGSMGNDFLL